MPNVLAVILAAGSGSRFGKDKVLLELRGRPVWRWSFEAFLRHPRIDAVGIVASPENIDAIRSLAPEASFVVLGGADRQASSRIACTSAPEGYDAILIHDGARPFVSAETIDAVIEGIAAHGAAAAATPVTDTIKERSEAGVRTLDRSRLWAMQTPQGARRDLLQHAHEKAPSSCTDEMELIEALGHPIELVPGNRDNFKITTAEDWALAQALAGTEVQRVERAGEVRTGFGYDIHPFSQQSDRPLMLGGVRFDGHPGLEGHSDADVLLHAVVDAVLGAAGLGDIGQHFSNTDTRWKDRSSIFFLESAKDLVLNQGWRILNIDATVVAESPRVMAQEAAIRSTIANAAGLDPQRINVKATTNERLGSIGRNEGIAAFAVATLQLMNPQEG